MTCGRKLSGRLRRAKMIWKDDDMMLFKRLMAAPLAALFMLVFAVSANAALKGIIQDGRIDPIPMAITPFLSTGADDVAATISGVVANDLGRSGYFNPIPPDSYPEQISSLDTEPAFDAWRGIKVRALVTGAKKFV
jgi:TolB protein